MKKLKITANEIKKFDQFETDGGTVIVLSVVKPWEVKVWGDLCAIGKEPERISACFSPLDTIAVFR